MSFSKLSQHWSAENFNINDLVNSPAKRYIGVAAISVGCWMLLTKTIAYAWAKNRVNVGCSSTLPPHPIPPQNPKVFAHRGGAWDDIENTVEAFDRAIETNIVSWLQIDVMLTKDEVPVLFHDTADENNFSKLLNVETLPHHSNSDKDSIETINYDNLPSFRSQIPIFFTDSYHVLNKKEPWGAQLKVAKFEQLLGLLDTKYRNKVGLLIEFWTVDDASSQEGNERLYKLINNVYLLLKKYQINIKTNVIWGCPMNENVIQICKTIDENITRISTFKQITRLLIHYYLGTLPFVTLENNMILNTPLVTSSMIGLVHKMVKKRLDKENSARIKRYILSGLVSIAGVGFTMFFNRFAFWQHLQNRGMPVVVWILNDKKEWKQTIIEKKHKVSGIQTDSPIQLKQFLIANDKEKGSQTQIPSRLSKI